MNYKILADSPALYEFADEKTRKSVFDALILKGKTTNYHFDDILYIQGQKNKQDLNIKETPVLTVGGKLFISQSVKTIFEKYKVSGEYARSTKSVPS
ncbi:hypothetical protein [Maribacter luteus]|uniref:hypothetical protein n=1 Tax=Maribacter luteus TaxID=2594478 RepID=UPI00249248C6|nr:hypothetical protein [Maribacter luteus]